MVTFIFISFLLLAPEFVNSMLEFLWKTSFVIPSRRSQEEPQQNYQSSETAHVDLYRIPRMIWDRKDIPEEIVKGIFVMFYKKKDHNCFASYRVICLLSHTYKLLLTVISKRMWTCDNIWAIKMILRE